MTDHKWRKDRDGAESCEREGCTVRKHVIGWNRDVTEWQRTRRGHWRQTMPLPPCAGKEAGEAKPAPFPLEKARSQLTDALNWLRTVDESETGQRLAFDGLRALATLEESIRADELAMAITQAEDEANNHPLVSTSMRLRVRLSKLRGKAESLEKWEESIRKDAAEKACEAVHKAMMLGRDRWAVSDAVDKAIITRK